MADRDDILKERQEQEYLGVWWIPSADAEQRNVSGVIELLRAKNWICNSWAPFRRAKGNLPLRIILSSMAQVMG